MKAAVRTSYEPPDVVRVLDVDKPTIKGDEVLSLPSRADAGRPGSAGARAPRPFLARTDALTATIVLPKRAPHAQQAEPVGVLPTASRRLEPSWPSARPSHPCR